MTREQMLIGGLQCDRCRKVSLIYELTRRGEIGRCSKCGHDNLLSRQGHAAQPRRKPHGSKKDRLRRKWGSLAHRRGVLAQERIA